MLHKTVTIASLIAFLTIGATTVLAGESGCTPQYGGKECPNVVITLDKKVGNPKSDTKVDAKGGSVEKSTSDLEYLDNIASSDTDKRFHPTQRIVFQLKVKNTSNQTVKDVTVSDKIPFDTVENITTSGSFDASSKVVTIKVDELKANEERVFYITGTIVTSDRLPSEHDVVCSVNQSYVTVSGQRVDEDNAAFCIEKGGKTTSKGGLPVYEAPKTKTTPPTGPEALALIPLAGSALTGLILRRKSK